MKRIILAVMVCLLLTACAGVVEMTEYRSTLRKVNPLYTNEDLVLFREKSDKKYMSKYGATTHDDTWEFYVVEEYAANGTIFYSKYNFKTAYNPLDTFGRGYTPESQVHGVYIYNPRVNLFVRVPGDNKKAYGYSRTAVSGKNIYDRLEFYAPVGKTKQFLQLLSVNQTDLRGYYKFALKMLGYRNILKSRPINDKPIVDEMNAYFAQHKDKACSISAKLKAADPNNISTEEGFSEKYCVIGARVLQEMFSDLKELRGKYQKYNGIDPLLNSPDKNLGYEKVNIAETMPEVMKKLPVSYESKLGKRGGIAVHDGPEELWLTDTVSNFLSAFTKL